jgi:AcrR family transcriptional regulator
MEVVREVGYVRATTRAIVDAAGVAEGTIYRHFAHKHELSFAAIFDRNAPIVEWVAGLPERAGTRTVAENLTECLERLASLRDEPTLGSVVLDGATAERCGFFNRAYARPKSTNSSEACRRDRRLLGAPPISPSPLAPLGRLSRGHHAWRRSRPR